MNRRRTTALQLCPFSSYLETALTARFELIRWFEMTGIERQTWLNQRAETVRAIVTGGHIGCGRDLMAALPSLGIVAVNGVGADKVDLDFARIRGVRVTTTPGIPTEDVADLAVGLIIGLLREIPHADDFVRAGRWVEGDRPLARKVTGRRFGIVGLGSIGSAIAARLAAFGPVAYTGPRRKSVHFAVHAELLELAKASDVLVLACPANEATRNLIGPEVLDALGSEGYLVNVARGAVLDETALIEALEGGRIAGAALDVFADEPHVSERLRVHPRVLLTPHIASATVESRRQMADLVLGNLDAFLNGRTLATPVA